MNNASGFDRRALLGTATAFLAGVALGGCGSNPAGGAGILVVGSGGGAPRRLTDEPARPAWSPDGSRIAWSSEAGTSVIAVDGTGHRRLHSGKRNGVPAWSPDGAILAWIDTDARAIVFAPLDGSEPRPFPLLSPGADDGLVAIARRNQPSWAPDGDAIAFVSWDGNGDEVYRMSPDGTGRRRLSSIRASGQPVDAENRLGQRKAVSDAVRPDWSPLGERIAFGLAAEVAGAPSGVFVVAADGRRQRKLTGRLPAFGPLWSPSGATILFVHRNERGSALYLLDPLLGVVRNLTFGKGIEPFDAAWAPDGRRIALSAGGAILVMDLESRETTTVADTPLDDRSPAWSPDGRQIAFLAEEDLFELPAMPDIP